jgi:hypothetical protein
VNILDIQRGGKLDEVLHLGDILLSDCHGERDIEVVVSEKANVPDRSVEGPRPTQEIVNISGSVDTYLEVQAASVGLVKPIFRVSHSDGVCEDHYVCIRMLENVVAYFGKAFVNERFTAGEVEYPAAQAKGLVNCWQQSLRAQFDRPVRAGGEHAVRTPEIAVIGHVKPALFEGLESESSGTTRVGPGGGQGEPSQEPPD